jgi:hypothetical protein
MITNFDTDFTGKENDRLTFPLKHKNLSNIRE